VIVALRDAAAMIAPEKTAPPPDAASRQDDAYREAAATHGAALARLARGYEADPERRRDLIQEIHVALWRSLAGFDGRCSLRTWVYRVAQNVGASYVLRDQRRHARGFVSLAELDALPAGDDTERAAERRLALSQLLALVHRLAPVDRQVILMYLEGLDAASIGEVTGLRPDHVAVKIHRLKRVLASRFTEQGGSP
jgi:RNA polymerase sigma-70 factor (ECF subfamily)